MKVNSYFASYIPSSYGTHIVTTSTTFVFKLTQDLIQPHQCQTWPRVARALERAELEQRSYGVAARRSYIYI